MYIFHQMFKFFLFHQAIKFLSDIVIPIYFPLSAVGESGNNIYFHRNNKNVRSGCRQKE